MGPKPMPPAKSKQLSPSKAAATTNTRSISKSPPSKGKQPDMKSETLPKITTPKAASPIKQPTPKAEISVVNTKEASSSNAAAGEVAVVAAQTAEALEATEQDHGEAEAAALARRQHGRVVLKYEMYSEQFDIAQGSTTAAVVDDAYCLSFVMPQCRIHLSEWDPPTKVEKEGHVDVFVREDPVGTYHGLEADRTYYVYIEQEADQLARDQAAMRTTAATMEGAASMTKADKKDDDGRGFESCRYEPQGRYAKAGKLRREDVETLMQGGALDHIWSWVQHNIKSTEAINMLRRNLHVSHQALTSPDAMEIKKRRIAALTEKRRLLHDAVSKLQAENKQAIANLVSVEQAMTSICDPPIQALLEDTYVLQTQYRHQERAWLQSYGDELVLELKSLDAAAAAAADHMSAMASFETRLDHAHTSVASAFRTNRALVVDILDRQSKLLLFLQSEVVDAFKVGSY
ncbi:hypothetical protein DYB35_000908 [Aphanomyces astaci]|uniref:Uncharacterized protein n=1 Tax=Aphanomyces astaci TaxID=112090 RepID=A0A3R7A1G4_APHAT|nr:hypothetical protein DYB35_000908 [Aphanomyces astaci]